MSTNNFNGNSFGGAGAYAFQRSKMLTGDPTAAMQSTQLSTSYERVPFERQAYYRARDSQ